MDIPIPRYRPMLASAGAVRGEAREWAFEPKMDGWRAQVRVASGRLRLTTRNGHDVTQSVPELAPMANEFFGRSVVLDGELVAHKGTPSSFYRLAGRMNARRPVAVDMARRRTPATFCAFDVLWVDGDDVTGASYVERRKLLESFDLTGSSWCVVSSFVGDGAELFKACFDLGLEGLVAKRLTSRYEPGARSKHWVKVKNPDWLHVHAEHRHSQ